MNISKVHPMYSTTVTVTGGAKRHASSNDPILDIDIAIPKSMGGDGGIGANPQQLFAAAFATCFQGILPLAAKEFENIDTSGAEVMCKVGIGQEGEGFAIKADIMVYIKHLDIELVQKIVTRSSELCPYSKAVKNNIETSFTAVIIQP